MTYEDPSGAGPREPSVENDFPVGSARKVFWLSARLAIAGGLLAFLAKSGMIDARALSKPFTAWPIALVAVALILIDVALMGLRLSLLFRPRGLRLPWAKSFQLTLISFFSHNFCRAQRVAIWRGSFTSQKTAEAAARKSSPYRFSIARSACFHCWSCLCYSPRHSPD